MDTTAEPVRSIPALVEALRGLDLFTDAAAVSYQIRFADARATEAAELRARTDGWSTSVFADAGGWVLRLACRGAVTLSGLYRDRSYVRALAAEDDGSWDAFAVEALEPANVWEQLAQQLQPAQPEADELPAPIVIPSQRRSSETLTESPLERVSSE